MNASNSSAGARVLKVVLLVVSLAVVVGARYWRQTRRAEQQEAARQEQQRAELQESVRRSIAESMDKARREREAAEPAPSP
jgi:uncharacterized protein HemX